MPLQVSTVHAFNDNFIWLIHGSGCDNRRVAIVDPGDAKPVMDYLEQHQLEAAAILITHHHGDHIGGINSLLSHYDIPVYGPARESIPHLTYPLKAKDQVELLGHQFEVLDVPGHTLGHIAYYGEGALFIGDTLFAGGCGRVFEGTFEQMHHSIDQLNSLPDETLIYCAHEYTLDNLGFALWVEPDNPALISRMQQAKAVRAQQKDTVPSTLAIEKQTNPFLRYNEPTVIQAAETFAGRPLDLPAEVFATVRHWKDSKYD